MITDNTDWKIPAADPTKTAELANELGITEYTAGILINRGITVPDEAKAYLSVPESVNIESWDHEKSDLIGRRLADAVKNQELITIHGDYDVDGITGSAILSQFLKAKNAHFNCYLPNRFTDGYGLSCKTVDLLAENGTKLIITSDCGISNSAEIEYARQKGIDVIVTDHHTIPEVLPDSPYLFHPGLIKGSGCEILSGAGTALHLVAAIDHLIPSAVRFDPDAYLDLAAIGTIADVCPLKGINRSIVQLGLKNTGRRPALAEMLRRNNLTVNNFTARDISFKIIPLLNAAGRMEDPKLALDFLLAESEDKISTLLEKLENLNAERRLLGEKTLAEIEQMIEEDPVLKNDSVLVIAGEHFHHGIIGILCARLSEKYNKAVFLLTIEGEISRGSARSKELHLVEALKSCADLLEKFGGHKNAAGFSIKTANISDFRAKILKFAESNCETGTEIITAETEIPVEAVSHKLYKEFKAMEPFGEGNPPPVIAVRACHIFNQSVSKNGLHLFAYTGTPDKKLRVNFWKSGELYPLPDKIDLIYEITENNWNNKVSLELNAKCFKKTVEPEKMKWSGRHRLGFDLNMLTLVENTGYLYSGANVNEVIFANDPGVLINNAHFVRFSGNFDDLVTQYSRSELIFFCAKKRIFKFPVGSLSEIPNEKILVLSGLPLKTGFLHHIIEMVQPKSIVMLLNELNKYNEINSTALRELLKLLYFNRFDPAKLLAEVTEHLGFSRYELAKSIKILMEANFLVTEPDGSYLDFSGKGLVLNSLNSYREYLEEQHKYEHFCNIMERGSFDRISEVLKIKNDGAY